MRLRPGRVSLSSSPTTRPPQGSQTTWVRRPARDPAPRQRVAFPFRQQGRRPQFEVFEAQYLARRCPCLRFGPHLAMRSARLGVRMDSPLLSCRTLSFLIACRFIPAHCPPHLGTVNNYIRPDTSRAAALNRDGQYTGPIVFSLLLHCAPIEEDLLTAELWEQNTAGIADEPGGLRAFFEEDARAREMLQRFAGFAPELRIEADTDWARVSRSFAPELRIEAETDWARVSRDAWPPMLV